MFPVNGSLHMAPRFPRSGPGESGSPMSSVLSRCYDFPPRLSGRLLASLPGSTRSSSLRVSQSCAPGCLEKPSEPGSLFNRQPQSTGLLARGRERDLPGFQAIHPVPLPRSSTPAEPTTPRRSTVSPMLPPRFPRRRLQRLVNFGAQSRGLGTRCLRFTNDVATTHARLASGWLASPLPGGRRTLWIAAKGFSSSHPPLLDLAWRKGSFTPSLPDYSSGSHSNCLL